MADMDSAVKFYDRMMNGTDSVLTIDPFQPSERARTMIVPLTDDVAAASKRQGISIGSFLTAAFAYTLTRYTGDSRAVFFTVDHGRYAPEVMDAVGLYARIFPICINCSGKSIKEFLLKAHEVISGAMFNARMTFGECVARYGIRSDFMFQYSGGLFFSSDNEEEGRYEDDESLRDISFYAVQKQDRIDVKVVFSPRYTAISDSMCDTFLSVVKGLMNDGNLPEIRPQKK